MVEIIAMFLFLIFIALAICCAILHNIDSNIVAYLNQSMAQPPGGE